MPGRRGPALDLPAPDTLFPENRRAAIVAFWILYWFWFFALLPWMLLRQVGVTLLQTTGALRTWNRDVSLLGGELRLLFMNGLPALAVTALFGERFAAIAYRGVLVDPGPPFAGGRLRARLESLGSSIEAVACTHSHEEHVGNAPLAAEITGAPVFGSRITLGAIRAPERLSLPRRLFIGQPQPSPDADLREVGRKLETKATSLEVIQSPGHCEGHTSLYDGQRGILFAGDSFLHTVFTAPNRDVSAADWIETLRQYRALDIRTMIGTHGYVYSIDPEIPPKAFLVKHRDPGRMIQDKLDFMIWAREVVAEGERRGLRYSVVEACLFPWQRRWSWENWFTDESGRLFSAGEFSRTYFVRSLSATPERVPARFPPFARLVGWLSRRFSGGAGRDG